MTCASVPSRIASVFAAALALLVATGARADDNHHQNYIVGERALGLAGAFTAIADDSSGAFYNPAGLAEAGHSSLSLSTALYGFSRESLSIDARGIESAENTFVTYPTTAAWVQRLREGGADGRGRMQLALSLITPRSTVRRRRLGYQLEQPTTEPDSQILIDLFGIELVEDDTLWIGLSYAWKVHRRLSLGATLYTTVRSGQYNFYDVALLHGLTAGVEVDRAMIPDRVEARLRHIGMLGVFGALVAITDRLRLGLAFRTPLAQLDGSIEINGIEVAGVNIDQSEVSTTDRSGTFNDRQPFKATVGLAYLVARRYGLSLDFSIYGPQDKYQMVSDTGDPELDQGLPMKKRLLWQLNVGGEYYPVPSLALRGGFFTNLSSLERCERPGAEPNIACNEVFEDPVDRFGFASSISYEMARASLTLGASLTTGSTDTDLGQGLSLSISRSQLFLLLGGAFRF